MIYLFFILWFAYWSAESGASLPWSSKWQDIKDWYSEVPEAIIALSVAGLAAWGWQKITGIVMHIVINPYGWVLDVTWILMFLGFIISAAIAYAGKQSATWAYLTWTSHTPRSPNRQSTLRPFNDFIGKLFGYRLGDEGYSWIWAATKGFIMTLPLGGTGLLFHPLGHEAGSHAEDRLPGDPNMWKELAGGGIGIGAAAGVFYFVANMIN